MITQKNLLTILVWFIASALTAQTPTPVIYSAVLTVDELNTAANADAYPWISGDGLRLYFTQEIVDDDRLWVASRASVDDPFGTAVHLLPNEPIEQVSSWLSADELTLWFTSGNVVRKSVRASMSDPFGASVDLTLIGFSGTVKSPTLTPDEEQLIVYSAGNVMLQRTGTNEYTQQSAVLTGATGTGPMKMSNDGLTTWFSAEHLGTRIPHRMTRASTTDVWSGLQYFAGSEFDASFGWIQPHLTPNGAILVGTRSSTGTWQGNDLFSALGDVLSAVAETWVDVPAVYPNPANDRISVALPAGWPKADLQLIDATGRLCMQRTLQQQDPASLEVGSLRSGLYTVQLVFGTERISHRVVIER